MLRALGELLGVGLLYVSPAEYRARASSLRGWFLELHLRDSDSIVWARVLGLEINVPR